jgi:hypothetical protein
MYIGVGTAVAASTGFCLPGIAAAAANHPVLTTLLHTAPIPVSTAAGTLGNVLAAPAARTICIPLTVANPSTATVLAAGSPALLPGVGAGASFEFNGAAAAANAGTWLVLMYQ